MDNDKKEDVPPEAEEWWTKRTVREHGKRLDHMDKQLNDPETGILPRLKRTEREINRWLGRENWWKGILNKVIGTVLVGMVMAVLGRLGTYFWMLF